ncbi:MAG: molecular chaperone HtpG [Clostridiales bacterium]|nr:molecular chaperone HtpG [Candidatus Crickella merdequi]
MQKQFQAESQRLLDMMINSIYTHKEIFLREIISNASDAIDKMRYIALTEDTGMDINNFEIILTLDKENRTLTVSDNGIGMSAEELEKNLGTIAFSGSGEFSRNLENSKDNNAEAVDIIGQFGVGFYSAFMVADKVTVISKKYGEEQAHKWESEGVTGFTIEDAEKETVGTDIIMHIKQDGETEDEFSKYVREYTIYKLVRKYSDYIRFPIKMLMPHPQVVEGSDPENPEYEEVFEYEVFNSMVPLWQRKKGDVTEEEYNEFYQQKYGDDTPPMSVITASVEGLVSYDAMLFIPKRIPNKYYSDDFEGGLQLYSSGVLIMENCKDLLPEHFNFVRGVVDSPDLSLNVSREMLQHDRQLKLISSNLEKKIKAKLEDLLKNEREKYEEFFKGFGRQLKVCALDDYGAKKEALQDFLLFYSSTQKGMVTLAEYVDRMKDDQKYIYYAAGDSIEGIDRMPQTEILKDRNIEILYFTDNMDEFISDMFRNYKEKPFMSVIDGDFDLGDEKDERIDVIFADTFEFIKEALGDKVDTVKASSKLKSHPVCLSSGDGVTFEMEKYFTAVNPEMGVKAKRILEFNVDHDAFLAIEKARKDDEQRAKDICEILYNQALMIAGLPIENPSDYTTLICKFF